MSHKQLCYNFQSKKRDKIPEFGNFGVRNIPNTQPKYRSVFFDKIIRKGSQMNRYSAIKANVRCLVKKKKVNKNTMLRCILASLLSA